MELTQQQKEVFSQLESFMNSDASVFILRGYAGTGKTTMVKVIADYIQKSRKVLLMAPTGRAARVLSQKSGHKATTIHRAIYGNHCIISKEVKDIAASEFKFVFPICVLDNVNSLAIIVDEASMVPSKIAEQELYSYGTNNLMEDLLTFARLNFGNKLILVGDPAQLPPVTDSVSNALQAEYFQEKGLKVVEAELTEVLRQKGNSVILKNAMKIRDLLKKEQRNNLVFEEQKDDVERIPAAQFLDRYLKSLEESGSGENIMICFSNKSVNGYNKEIRNSLYGKDMPLQKGETLMVTQNNMVHGVVNGEFVTVVSVGKREEQSAPVYVEEGGQKIKKIITLKFQQVSLCNGFGDIKDCFLLEDLLYNDFPSISIEEHKALYVNFCMRNPDLKSPTIRSNEEESQSFVNALKADPYYNAVRAKFGYAVTGHKCQGGEWNRAFVDYTNRTGLDDDCLRWAYTATTRAQKTLYIANYPNITPFKKFNIQKIQKCRNIDSECRILKEAPSTPYHSVDVDNGVRAKYHCIVSNMANSLYSIQRVESHNFHEIYYIQTPDGVDRFDLYYKAGAIFQPATPRSSNKHTLEICSLLNDERDMPCEFNYTPSDEVHAKLYTLIRSACDSCKVQITNVVERKEQYFVIFYMRTSGTFSYIRANINAKGFVTYAAPMSFKGAEDEELKSVIDAINSQLE